MKKPYFRPSSAERWTMCPDYPRMRRTFGIWWVSGSFIGRRVTAFGLDPVATVMRWKRKHAAMRARQNEPR